MACLLHDGNQCVAVHTGSPWLLCMCVCIRVCVLVLAANTGNKSVLVLHTFSRPQLLLVFKLNAGVSGTVSVCKYGVCVPFTNTVIQFDTTVELTGLHQWCIHALAEPICCFY